MASKYSDFSEKFNLDKELLTMSLPKDNISFEILYDGSNKKMALNVLDYASKIIDFYESFGESTIKKFQVVIPSCKYNIGGYSEKFRLVLSPRSDFGENTEFFKFLANEIAQLWWCNGNSDTWENWLNESFSEYSALIACREIMDSDFYSDKLSCYSNISSLLPPLKGINVKHPRAHHVLFAKGSFILSQLENIMSKESFMKLLKEANTQKISSTDDLMDLISEKFQPSYSKTLRDLLVG